ncbi:hypothetical protein ABK905_19605 [Acerihabitans sp. KWT182]|uniref:DUF4189 domain-containing protein n=1 Tax=Acerihabitans sp. KWT182 TaxID=3157919 RepID=A0AAU7Q751_9GAMM
MKYTTLILAATVLFSTSSFAAKEITREQSATYTKIGDFSITQPGTPSVGHKKIAKQANEKCHEAGGIKAKDCFFVIAERVGNASDHKTVEVEVYKK